MPATWSRRGLVALTAVPSTSALDAERASHDRTRRQLSAALARIERLLDELTATRAGTPSEWEALARRQATQLDALQKSQLARDVEMAEHLSRHVCTPKAADPAPAPAQVSTQGVRW